MSRISAAWAMNRSWKRSRTAARSSSERRAHVTWAARAAATAAATSAGVPAGTSASTSPVSGASIGIHSTGAATATRAARRVSMAALTRDDHWRS